MIPLPLIAAQLVLAIGAALALGTLAAMIRYWRTGAFPGRPTEADASDHRLALRLAWAKVLAGTFLLVWGIASLSAQGVL